jgi:hypothetical protein
MVIKYLKEKENFDMKGLKLKGPSNYKYRQVLTENMFEQYKDVIANIFEHNIKDELNDAPYPRECY